MKLTSIKLVKGLASLVPEGALLMVDMEILVDLTSLVPEGGMLSADVEGLVELANCESDVIGSNDKYTSNNDYIHVDSSYIYK